MSGGSDIGLKIYSGCAFDKDANGYLDTGELYQLYNGTAASSLEDPVCGEASKDATLGIFNDAIRAGQSEQEVVAVFLGLRDNVRNAFFCNSVLNDREAFLGVLRRNSSDAADRLEGGAKCVESAETPEEIEKDVLRIAPHGTAIIDGVSITAQDRPVTVYLKATGVPGPSNAVVFDRENKRLIICQDKDGGGILVSLLPGNPFVPAFGSDRMMVTVESSDKCRVEIGDRSGQGRIPLVTVMGPARMTVRNGINSLTLAADANDNIFNWSVGKNYNSDSWGEMPVEIRAYDGAGRGLKMRWSNYLGSRERTGEALIMDNYGGFALIDDGTYDASLFDCETSVELGDQREFTRSDFIDHVAALGAPHIELIGDVGSAEIRQVMRYLAALPPDVLASIDKISYEQPAELNERCSKDAAACAAGRTIYLTRSKTDMGVFYHESAHVLHYALNRRGSAFEKKWLAANGAPYGNLSRPISLGYVWCDPSSADIGKPGMDDELLLRGLASEASGPRYGFAGAYGNKNCLEDVADFVRLFREAPDEFRPLIDRGDPKYDANYGDVYRAKLRLLIEYGFIAVEEVPDWMFKCLYGQEQG